MYMGTLNNMPVFSCTDPENFVRGGPILTFFVVALFFR